VDGATRSDVRAAGRRRSLRRRDEWPGGTSVLAERWHLVLVAYAESAMVLVGFLLLAVVHLI